MTLRPLLRLVGGIALILSPLAAQVPPKAVPMRPGHLRRVDINSASKESLRRKPLSPQYFPSFPSTYASMCGM